MLDPIADMLTRIRNASRAGHKTVSFPASKVKLALAKILVKRGFLERVGTERDGVKERIVVTLGYVGTSPIEMRPILRDLRRVSREGCRVYVKHDEIRKVKNGYGVALISTSKGIMAGEDAYRQGLGGEYICEVW